MLSRAINIPLAPRVYYVPNTDIATPPFTVSFALIAIQGHNGSGIDSSHMGVAILSLAQ